MEASNAVLPDQIMWESGLVRLGAFRCGVHDKSFHDSGPAQNWCFVFPRTAVEIQHEHEPPFTANPNVVTFYNRSQVYRRNPISEEGDRCDWFGVDSILARDAVRTFDPNVDDRPENPFRMSRALSASSTYLLQRRIFRSISSGNLSDAFAIEESVIHLLNRVVSFAYWPGQPNVRTLVSRRQRAIVHEVEVFLSKRWNDPMRLQDVAGGFETSVFHLCRIFRRLTGSSMHQYRHRLRVRHCLEPLSESRKSITDIALASGFNSHSHFTAAFHREFGDTPVALR